MFYKQTLDSDISINYTDDAITLAAGDMSVSSSKSSGNFILGPLSITTPFTNIRFNSGLFKFNSLLLSTMPSNLITPVPVFEFDAPIQNLSLLAKVSQMLFGTVASSSTAALGF